MQFGRGYAQALLSLLPSPRDEHAIIALLTHKTCSKRGAKCEHRTDPCRTWCINTTKFLKLDATWILTCYLDSCLHELGSSKLEEDGIRLLGASTRKQGFSRSRGTMKQDALGRADADVVEHMLVGHGQYHSLDQLLNFLIQACAEIKMLLRMHTEEAFRGIVRETVDRQSLNCDCDMIDYFSTSSA